jgi:hypothetical protein
VPDSAYLGSDSFGYRATDSVGDYAEATVSLNVAGPPSAAISSPSAGGTYVVGQGVSTAFSCSEGAGGTGLSSCNDSSGTTSVSGGAGRLDTATVGPHTYAAIAVSKDGLTDNASISYTVVPAPEPPKPPNSPQGTPSGPEVPVLRIELSAGAEKESLRELLRTGELVVVARLNEAARVTLNGGAKLKVRAGRKQSTKIVSVFKEKTVSFVGAGEKRVTLVLSRRGRETLQRLVRLQLLVTAEATNTADETAARKVTLTLWD